MKKILHISKYYYPYLGGTETVCQDIVEGLKGCENRVICFNDSHATESDEVNGIQVFRVGCFTKFASQSLAWRYYSYLRIIIKNWLPDVIHFHSPNPFASFFLLRLIAPDVKLIVHWHLDIIKQKYIYLIVKRYETKLLRRADLILVTSPNYRNASLPLRSFFDKVKIVPNGIHTQRLDLRDGDYKRMADIRSIYQFKKIVFFVGRHVEYKGLKYLIEAEQYIQMDCQIVIAGIGPLTESLKDKANLGRVSFIGRLSSDDLRCYLHLAEVFAFPSITKNEAFGLALAEAMYCECPAVTFHIEGSGVNWVSLDGETGLEVENANAQQYALAIDKLLSDDILRKQYAIAAKKRVIDFFTVQKEQELISNIYDNLLNMY